MGNEVTEYSLKQNKKGMIPFWKWKISKHDIGSIKGIQSNFDRIIISHENLADLTEHIRCDLFIFHNLTPQIHIIQSGEFRPHLFVFSFLGRLILQLPLLQIPLLSQ